MKHGVLLAVILLVLATCLLPIAALAEGATPSIEANGAPTVVPCGEDDEGPICAVIVYHDTGEIFKSLHSTDFHITSYADRASAGDEIRIPLEAAMSEIRNANNLGALNADLRAAAKSLDESFNESIFVAYELFDLTLTPEYAQYLRDNGYDLRVTFSTGFAPAGKVPYVMHRDSENENWILVATENVTDNGDGTFTVLFSSLCPVAFLKTDAARLTPDGGAFGWWWILLLILVLIALTVTAFVLKRHYSKKKN